MKVKLYHIVTEAFRIIDVAYEIKAIIWRFTNSAARRKILTNKNYHFISWRHLWSCAFEKNSNLNRYAHIWTKNPSRAFMSKKSYFEQSQDFFRRRFADRSRKWWSSSAKLRRAIEGKAR